MKLLMKKGKTSQIAHIFLQDSAVTTGAGKSGLTNGSAGLTCYRARLDDGNAAGTQLVLSGGTLGTWSSGGFKEKDATNMIGIYELGLDNAGLATGSDRVVYYIIATGVAPCVLEIQLVDFDPQDTVRLGLTAMPNVASGGAGAIPITGTGANAIAVDGSGNVSVTSGIKKNAARSGFTFTMTDSTTHAPKPGIGAGVAPTVSRDGGAFGATTNAVSEIAFGDYKIDLSAADLNGSIVMLRFTATNADDLNILIVTQT